MTTERSSEISSPYAAQPAATSEAAPATTSASKPFDLDTVKKVRTVHLAQAKATGQKFSMLTCYDALTAQIFDRAGIDMLLVGDSAANVVLGYESTLTITLDEMIPMVAAVSRGASRAMVVADLPLAEAGAFCVLMEMVTTETARRVDEAVGAVPTIGIGASNVTTGQVLVWQDMMGVRSGRVPRFVKQFAQVGQVMEDAARAYREQV